MREPSAANREAFEAAVQQITEITQALLLQQLETRAAPRDREVEAGKARARGRKRDERMRKKLLEG